MKKAIPYMLIGSLCAGILVLATMVMNRKPIPETPVKDQNSSVKDSGEPPDRPEAPEVEILERAVTVIPESRQKWKGVFELEGIRASQLNLFEALIAEKTDESTRISTARYLPLDLNIHERELLYGYLFEIEYVDSLNKQSQYLLTEIIMEALRKQEDGAPGLATVLQKVYMDQEVDPVIRGYAVQHMGLWYREQKEDPEVETMIWDATEFVKYPLSGTALIALDQLREEGKSIEVSRLLDRSLAILNNPESSTPTRMAALEIGARHHDVRLRDYAKDLAETGSTLPLRLVAISAIGRVGTEEDIPKLKHWLEDENDRHRIAAKWALEQLEKRNSHL
ncbi:MAG: HEAT repeat domain-containing protein [Kiritimatiellae bacterium]|jgi:hypothetical protein|nr:HEAT repeat domain-containing protein [Kiritimatiellia bacterium]